MNNDRTQSRLDAEKMNQLLSSFALATGLDAFYSSADEAVQMSTAECPGTAFCSIIRSCPNGLARCKKSHADCGLAAYRLGEPYISRCHAGLVTITAPVVRAESYLGSITCCPAMMWDWDEVAVQELVQHTADLPLSREVLLVTSRSIRVLTSKQASAIADILYSTATSFTAEEGPQLVTNRTINHQQMHMAGVIMETKQADAAISALEQRSQSSYPLYMERELLGKVRVGDRAGARGILNDLMGHIFYRTAGNLDVMKARILELVIMISRAAVEGGASLEKLFGLNYNFIAELSGLMVYEDICLWVVRMLDAFMDTVYETRNIKNARFLGDALEYIRAHYVTNLTLEEVAQQIHISPFYLSHLFKEELDITFIEYLTRVRIEEARRLLTQTNSSVQDIALQVGYEDPSYFSKVFKKLTGITPNRYRRGT